ncbi:MAG: RuBisCO large subunit C-terminal-like domain-containing protein [Candidatus Methanomethylophilus sp.]|jgi:ribulose-bisphosphate carboxylase large chain|nr:RuBisCO large subunit C-terminal-like domain-containing protein [Methanomethylophilus sp.]MCI2074940.1 RuBisCO large subunit C-terminal-like domain-containing protein [Methanomethylophilus sp.]MCI2093628.1 RuBisCO large subunit C-terminal-like domain-containing protein [Methanomethylophilus sp.]
MESYKSYSYLDLGAELDPEGYVFATYRVTTDLPMEKAAEAVAAEQSTGTWTGLSTLKDDVFEKYAGRVTSIEGDRIVIAFPVDDFSGRYGGIPQILSVIAGNLFGLAAVKGIRLEDAVFPQKFLKEHFKGPKFGSEGMRKMLQRPEKPLVGTIVKPKIGLSPEDTAKYVYEAGVGGLTNGKDDETLVDQTFCPIEARTKAVAEALDRVDEEGGHMMHAINISSNADDIVGLAEDVQSWGAREIMVDVLTSGFGALQAVAEDPKIKVPIHVHRTMHAAITKDPLNGVAMNVFAELVRMCGGDALHIGTLGVGKMEGDIAGGRKSLEACRGDELPFRKVMPVCSGGMFPGIVPDVIAATGNEVQIQAGGGVAGHPGGVRAGAAAMCQAVDAAFSGVPLAEYAADHAELREALAKWGSR